MEFKTWMEDRNWNRAEVGDLVLTRGGSFGRVFWTGRVKGGYRKYGVRHKNGVRLFVFSDEVEWIVRHPLTPEEVEYLKQSNGVGDLLERLKEIDLAKEKK